MERERSIIIDDYQITLKTVQNAYRSAKLSNRSHLVLAETFKMMNLNKLYESNPGDQSVKHSIKSIVDSSFLPRIPQQNTFKVSFDLTEMFPLNKVGNFGRVLTRKCKLAEKGVMEYSDDQTPKLKEIKAFVNRVETIGSAGNDTKIEWYQESTKFPYRIVLIDANDGHKAIYFSSLEKAENIRIVLSQQYLFRGNFAKLIARCNQGYRLQAAQLFKNKLVSRQKMITKSNRFSRKIQLADQSAQESRFTKADPNASIFQKERGLHHQSVYRPNSEAASMLRTSNLLTKPMEPLFGKVNDGYLRELLMVWNQKAKLKAGSTMRVSQQGISRLNVGTEESIYKSRMQHLNERSSRKQESIFNRFSQDPSTLKKEKFKEKEKESYIKEFGKDYTDEYGQLECYSIEFLTLTNLFFKPIVTVELFRDNRAEQYILYNTVIQKKDPVLVYQLIKSKQDQQVPGLSLNASLKQYDLHIKVIDFLANEEVLTDTISMKEKRLLTKSRLTSDNKLVRLQLGPKKELLTSKAEMQPEPIRTQLRVPPVADTVRDKINQFWERQSQLQGYYNQSNLSLFRILSQVELIPLTWWKGCSEDEYELLQVVYSASKILGFKMIRSFPHVIRVFAALYQNVEQLTQKLLSFIITFLRPYYSAEHLNRIQKFHRILGLNEDCELISKVNLQILVIEKLVELECPALFDKLSRSNVCFGYTMMEYIYEAFSRNLTPQCLVELWNFIYEDLELLQLHMVLLSVALIKHYEEDLITIKRLKDFRRVLEGKKLTKVGLLLAFLNELKQKYFGEVRGIIDEIKSIFNSKPLEPVLHEFYKRESVKMDKTKSSRVLEKKSALRKVNKQVDIQFPEYPCQQYTLHIYFSRVPEVGGSLHIRCNDINYECLNHQKNRYFIIGDVSSNLTLAFIDLKSNEFSCQLVLNPGIQQHTALLTSPRTSTVHKISYVGALLTDSQIEIFKRGKKIDHFISPFIREVEFAEEMSRPVQETYFLRKYDSGSSRDDLVKRIKQLFCPGHKTFNQIEFYIEHIETSELTIEQKFFMVRSLARQFSTEFCLCSNEIFEKHFIRHFLESAGYSLSSKQYQCFYNDSLDYEFDAPKILKCRYFPSGQSTKEVKLEAPALAYYINKCANYLYCDIIIDDLMNALKPAIVEQLGKLVEGELKLYCSSNGQVFLKAWQLKLKSNRNDLYYEEIKEAAAEDLEVRDIGDPEVLMTEVLPSFAKISTILDFVNNSRPVDLKHKYQDKDRRRVAENINILKDCQGKFAKAIVMRHLEYPKKLHLPFFNYYYELTHDFTVPHIKNIVLNNLKSDLKTVCLFAGQLKFGENPKVQAFTYREDLGLYGNLRLMSKDAKGWFFFGSAKDDSESQKQGARVFVNYGYGIFRWEPCHILGFYRRSKNNQSKSSQKSPSSPQKAKKEYLIVRRNEEKTVKEYELEIGLESLAGVEEIFESGGRQSQNERSFVNEEEDAAGSSNLRYLSKFIR